MTMKPMIRRIFVVCLIVEAAFAQALRPDGAKASGPPLLSFEELKDLATTPEPKDTLAAKLSKLLTTPFIGKDLNDDGPHRPAVEGLGPILRAASWNIERGLNFDLIESALGNPRNFQQGSGYESRAGNNKEVVRNQLRKLQETDVLILNEVDLGMKRTGYRDVSREVRRGGRIALVVDLAVPELPAGRLTVVSVHLENKCRPGCRQRQMKALLSAIQPIDNPVILAGDLNTSGQDATPTSVRNEIMKRVTDYRFWVNQAIFWFSPVSIPHYAIIPLHYFHQHLDPTVWHFPFLWENRERGLFQSVGKFRFTDGYAFDFRGSTERTLTNRHRTLANSNQRGPKGFVPTYAFERNLGGWVGSFKLDWFFVKPFIKNPRARQQSYRFAPHFPVTMNELNRSAEDRLSDHPPMTVDLPLAEPLPLKSGPR